MRISRFLGQVFSLVHLRFEGFETSQFGDMGKARGKVGGNMT